MNGEITRDEIVAWHVERGAEATEQGKLTLVVLTRFSGNGTEVEIHSVKIAEATDFAKLGETMEIIATRDARGLGGVNLYQLAAIYGTAGKPSRFLPFRRAGALTSGVGPGGGLQTEGPTPTGIVATGQRWGELAIQQAGAKDVLITQVMERMLDKTLTRQEALEKNNLELWGALKGVLWDMQQNAMAIAQRELNAALMKKVVTLLPGLVNAMSGRDVFPQSVVEKSLLETIHTNFSSEEQRQIISMVAAHPNGAPVAAVLTDGLLRIRKEKDAEAKERDRLIEQATGRTYEDAERDAGGEAIRLMRGQPAQPAKQLPQGNGTNGHAKPAAAKAATADDPNLISDLFTQFGDLLPMVLTKMKSENPELAERVEAQLARMKGGQAT